MIFINIVQLSLISSVFCTFFGFSLVNNGNQLPKHDSCYENGDRALSRRSVLDENPLNSHGLNKRTFWLCSGKSKLMRRTFGSIFCPPEQSCPSGYTLNSSKTACCKSIKPNPTKPNPIVCGSGYVLDQAAQKCVIEANKCPSGIKYNPKDKKCYITGKKPNGGSCGSGYGLCYDNLCYPSVFNPWGPKNSCPAYYLYHSSDKKCHLKEVKPPNPPNEYCPPRTKYNPRDKKCYITGKKPNGGSCGPGYGLYSDKLCYPSVFNPWGPKNSCPAYYLYHSSDKKCHLKEVKPPNSSSSITTATDIIASSSASISMPTPITSPPISITTGTDVITSSSDSTSMPTPITSPPISITTATDEITSPPISTTTTTQIMPPTSTTINTTATETTSSNNCPSGYQNDPNTGSCAPVATITPNDKCPPNYAFFDGYGSLCYPYLPKLPNGECPQDSQPAPGYAAYCFCPDQPYFPGYPTMPTGH